MIKRGMTQRGPPRQKELNILLNCEKPIHYSGAIIFIQPTFMVSTRNTCYDDG